MSQPAPPTPPVLVVMGVSGCGKSTVGQDLAAALACEFVEGDAFHTPQNVAKMASGTPLTDEDRAGWLALLACKLADAAREQRGIVLACSALRRAYRDWLRSGAAQAVFVHLTGPRAVLAARTAARVGHYMPASLLESQLATLESPGADENALTFDIGLEPQAIVKAVRARLAGQELKGIAMPQFTKTVLFTDTDGRARFREESVPLDQGTPQSRLSEIFASGGYLLRESPVGFRSEFHCTGSPQWVFILQGQMEIGLQGGVSRVFSPGQHFYAIDHLPQGAVFDPKVHGHWSRQVGPDPLVTLFVRG